MSGFDELNDVSEYPACGVNDFETAKKLEKLDLMRIKLLAVNLKCNGGTEAVRKILSADSIGKCALTAREDRILCLYNDLHCAVTGSITGIRGYYNSSYKDRLHVVLGELPEFKTEVAR